MDRSAGGEADVSTQQDRAQASAWLPGQDGDGWRPQRDRSTSSTRPEEAFRLIVQPSVATRLKRRTDFMAVSRGRRVHCGPFTLQARRRTDADGKQAAPGARIGFTVTKKIGNAVERNRIRRRFREAVRLSEALSPEAQTDYVMVARREALTVPFSRLKADLEAAVRRSTERREGSSRRSGTAPQS